MVKRAWYRQPVILPVEAGGIVQGYKPPYGNYRSSKADTKVGDKELQAVSYWKD